LIRAHSFNRLIDAHLRRQSLGVVPHHLAYVGIRAELPDNLSLCVTQGHHSGQKWSEDAIRSP
jgi:hypothetical protein